jgi:hypothetical protein
MKKLICILASAALFGACEQKTEVTPAAAPPVDTKKAETNTTIVNPPPAKTETGAKPSTNTETKTESSTTTTTAASPNP